MNRLYLVRHGENLANVTKELSCRKVNYPLNVKGLLQAQQTAEYFADKGIHELYSSPLVRAVQTAQVIGQRLALPVTIMDEFLEMDLGTLEGPPITAGRWAQHDRIIDRWFAGDRRAPFPGGEDLETLWRRLQAGYMRVVAGKNGRNIVIVGHAGAFIFTLPDLCHVVDMQWLRSHPNHNTSVTEICVEACNGHLEGKLVTWASCDHLHDTASQLTFGTPQGTLLNTSA